MSRVREVWPLRRFILFTFYLTFFIFQELGRARRSCKTGKGTLWLQVCIADL